MVEILVGAAVGALCGAFHFLLLRRLVRDLLAGKGGMKTVLLLAAQLLIPLCILVPLALLLVGALIPAGVAMAAVLMSLSLVCFLRSRRD